MSKHCVQCGHQVTSWEDVNCSKCGGFAVKHSLSKGELFGKMLEIADVTMTCYKSDLFYDAVRIEQILDEKEELFWIPRESGTHLKDTLDSAQECVGKGTIYKLFKVKTDKPDPNEFRLYGIKSLG